MCSVARGILVCREQVEQRRVGVERRLVRVRDLARGAALEPRRDQHRVDLAARVVCPKMPDVGDVLDVQHLEPVVEQRAPDEVGEEERPEVADVGVAVDRRAARVHADPARLERLDAASDASACRGGVIAGQRAIAAEPNETPFPLSLGASRGRIVPRRCERGAFHCRRSRVVRSDPSTPVRILRMRQWACVVALLLGLAGNGYAATSACLPIAIERRLDRAIRAGRPAHRTLDWWRA